MGRGFQGQARFLKSPSATLTPPSSGLLGDETGRVSVALAFTLTTV